MEEEVRDILRNAVKEEERAEPGLGTQIAALFEGIGFDEEIPEQRGQPVRFPDFKS
jgi:plasmid stability protein